MRSIDERLRLLENDLLSTPMRISAYHDLPFAIFCYPPNEEFGLRNQIKLFKTRLENSGKKVLTISLADLLWDAVLAHDSIENVAEMEKKFGYPRMEETINQYLTIKDFSPLKEKILELIGDAKPETHVVFLYRAGAMAPNIFRMSTLLNLLHGNTMVPIILFYPGSKESESELRFMNMEDRRAISGYNYRVKIY
ncbi:BREX protein BrxB domain-containing protein [Calditrichota bacterium GD2]